MFGCSVVIGHTPGPWFRTDRPPGHAAGRVRRTSAARSDDRMRGGGAWNVGTESQEWRLFGIRARKPNPDVRRRGEVGVAETAL